ncbi:MAG: hypothetical protein CME70_13595 [Halobacteriovorax sp.]|nr:hypothetical protein [Halobacteriovorax sp.]|tara:strand:- start:493 stop:1557 length:1065 start_codon:yes stop_codon:yes gene_type:complete
MDWSRDLIEEHLLLRPSDQKVANVLNDIKQKYLEEKGESVPLNEIEVSAYTQFYMPTNARKFNFLWNQLPDQVKNEIKEIPFVDFGCGPGTYTWPAIELGIKGPFYGIDSNKDMVKQARKLSEGLFPDADVSFSHSEKGIDLDAPKTLLFGNAVNEMGVALTLKWIEKLNPRFLIFIEPGTSKVFKEILKMREELKERKYQVHYPCASLELECPVKNRRIGTGDNERDDWCHQVLREVPHPSIERLGQMAKMDRKVQPYIAHVYELDGVNKRAQKTARFVRFLNESKHSFSWEVCLFENDQQEIVEFEIIKKSMDKKTVKEFKKLSIGHEVSYDLIKDVAANKKRVSVKLLNGN